MYATRHGEATSRTDSRAGRERPHRPKTPSSSHPRIRRRYAPVEEAPPPAKPTTSKRPTRHWQAALDATEYEHIAILEHAGWNDEYECTSRAYAKGHGQLGERDLPNLTRNALEGFSPSSPGVLAPLVTAGFSMPKQV